MVRISPQTIGKKKNLKNIPVPIIAALALGMMGLASALGRFVLVSVSKLGVCPLRKRKTERREREKENIIITPNQRKEN